MSIVEGPTVKGETKKSGVSVREAGTLHTTGRFKDLEKAVMCKWCQWIQTTPSSTAIRESVYMYPIIESVHVLGLCVFVGLVGILDLRLVGASMTESSVTDVQERLFPWTMIGFGLMVASGALLFWSNPIRFYGNVFFRIKALLLLAAGANALIFHRTVFRSVNRWDHDRMTPWRARMAGCVSLVLWTSIVITGRLIAYNWFD